MANRPTPSQMELFTSYMTGAYAPQQLDLFPELLPRETIRAEVDHEEHRPSPRAKYWHGPERFPR